MVLTPAFTKCNGGLYFSRVEIRERLLKAFILTRYTCGLFLGTLMAYIFFILHINDISSSKKYEDQFQDDRNSPRTDTMVVYQLYATAACRIMLNFLLQTRTCLCKIGLI